MAKNDKQPKTEEKTEPDHIEKMMDELKKMEESEKKEKPETEETKPKTEVEIANEKIAELTITLQRLQAEFENYRKRAEKDSGLQREYASAPVITKLLPIIDTFEIAIKNSKDPEKFRKGMELIYAELMSVLKNEGVRKIDAAGKQLDPYLHDAMMAVEAKDKSKDTIIEVLQEGYKLKDRVIRHSKVKIAK